MQATHISPLFLGNHALRAGHYTEAVAHYARVLIDTPPLGKSISANLSIARQKYRRSRQGVERLRVGVCGWELAHNPAGRVYTLAILYETFTEVEIIGSIFPRFGREIWEPIRSTPIPKYSIVVEDESRFVEQAIALVAAHPYDIVHLSKPRIPNILFGILYKLIWDAKVLVDVDDEELGFVGADAAVSIDTYLKQNDQLPTMKDLAGKDWTRLAVGLVDTFDGITVSNPALQQRYGGVIVRHARDEKKYQPSPDLKRRSREKFGIPQEKNVVLFFGTPRAHKGLKETAKAIADLRRDDVVFVIVGDFPNNDFKNELQQIKSCQFIFIGNQPFDTIPEVVSIADCCVFLQDVSLSAQYQVPAKLSDALGMGIPAFANATPAMEEFFSSGAVENTSSAELKEQLSIFFQNEEVRYQRSDFARSCFARLLSFSGCLKSLKHCVSALSDKVDRNPAPAPLYTSIHSSSDLVMGYVSPENTQTRNIKRTTAKHYLHKAPKQTYRARIELIDGEFIQGWCVNTSKPEEVFDLQICLDGQPLITVKNDEARADLQRVGLSKGLGGIRFTNPAIYLDGGQYSISLRLPDGTFSDALNVEGKRFVTHRQGLLDRFPRRPVTIIVPIFNAPDDLEICIDRLLAYTPEFAKILLIDDCSTDPRIGQILSKHKNTTTIRILRNPENFGFTRTVNRGVNEAGEDDIVLLNSDARVTPRWLEGMLIAAYSAPRIATVTAMSDRAGAFSAPQMGNDNKLPEGVDEITYARAFRRRSLGLYPRVPTGNGFCMYVNRECVSSIGALDAQAFPRGYGEENDFCMRALRAGWSNIIDDRTYVFHDRSKSFGEAKTELMTAGRSVVDERYPEYKKAIQVFSGSVKIALARNRARLAMQDCVEALGSGWIPRVLFVVATQTGGTPQTNRDLMEALSGVFEGWLLRCDSKMLELSCMGDDGTTRVVRSCKLREPVDSLTHNSADYDSMVFNWLHEFDFDLVHIRHLGWHGLSLPRLARQLGKKVIYSFHDFYGLSSNFKLIDDAGVYLGSTFLEEGSDYRESLWPKDALPTPHGNWLGFWRERFQAALEHCDAFVTTADSARQLILDAMPRLPADRFVVIPHGRDFPEFHRVRQKPKSGEPIRILVPGHINAVKGLEIIRALIEYDKTGKLEFYILGRLIGEKPKKGVVSLGKYERHEFAEKARSVRPHLGIIFSVWDETYCHTLTELWSVGLPAAVLDFPNVADRVRRSGAGWVLAHHNISKLYEEIIRLALDGREYERTEQALADWQGGYGLANSTAQMAAGYLNIYSDVLREGGVQRQALSPCSRKRIGVVCPASADLRHAPGSTHIRIWERTRNAVDRNVTYIKMTPSMLIACAREKMLDGVIIQRTAVPQEMVENVIDVLNQSSIPYSLELDDDLLEVPGDKDPYGSYASYVPALRHLIASAGAVTVSTPALQDKMKTMHPRVVLLPNQLSDRLWRMAPRTRVMDGFLRALYMGSATHDDDLALVLPALDKVAQISPQFRLTLVGVTSRKDLAIGRPWLEVLNIPAKDYVNFTQWLRDQTDRFDFAIAPLRETSFNERKSDLKLIDYGALGLPVIASDVSVYRATNAPGVRLVGNETQEWANAFREQIALGEKNHRLGEQLRQWVVQERMLAKTLPEFDAFVLGLVDDKKAKPVEREVVKPSRVRIAVCVHVFYPHRWSLIATHLRNLQQDYDLFITCPVDIVTQLADVRADYPKATIIPVENVGMDVLPFLTVALQRELYRYDAVLKVHTKNDKAQIGDVLGRLALDGVLGTPELVDRVLDEFLCRTDIGMIGSECLYRSAAKVMYGNRQKIEKILDACSVDWPADEWGFFAGTMFWIRGSLLKTLICCYTEIVSEVHVEKEITSTGGDGNWAHAMERVFGLLPVLGGEKVAVSYPTTEKSGHTHLRKVHPAKFGSKRAFHGFSVNNLSRYNYLSIWAELCRNSDYFDEAYYRAQAGEIIPEEMDAATHFVLFGDMFGLNPSNQFSVSYYFKQNPEVANAKTSIPSLVHFLQYGIKEDRTILRVV